MKALTVWQPWASLIVGAPASYDEFDTPPQKPVENRDWRPPQSMIGERIAIHAGKTMNCDVLESFHNVFVAKDFGAVRAPYKTPREFPLGAIIGVATLDRVLGPIDSSIFYENRFAGVRTATIDSWGLDAEGLRWFVGRFGWVFRDRRALAAPVPCKGERKLWMLRGDVAAAVSAQIGREIGNG